jgi:hypothetical protein
MGDRTEYWWISRNEGIEPAQVGFIGGIPAWASIIGSADRIPSAHVELLERLPSPPAPVFRQPEQAAPPAPKARQGSWLWFIGILILIAVAQCSGPLFDMLRN